MRILLITTGLGLGGAEVQVVQLARKFTRAGDVVKVVALTGDNALPNELVKGLDIVLLKMTKSLPSIWNSVWKFRQIVNLFKPNIVHSHMVHANIFSRVARAFVKMPVLVSSAHNSYEGGRLRMLAYRLTSPLATLTTNVSKEAAAAFVKNGACCASDIRVMYNGIPVAEFFREIQVRRTVRAKLGLGVDDFCWVSVARLVPAKDHQTLIEAVDECVNGFKAEGLRIVLVGSGPLEAELRSLVNERGLEDKVKFLGARHDVPEILAAADGFVLSSLWEGFGIVIGEAMAAGLPVVSTDCGGTAEVCGNIGLLVPKGDPSSLAAAMSKVMSLSAFERSEMGSQGRQWVAERFSLESVAAKWRELYSELAVR